ncbi:type IV pili glycosylation protein, partial [Francisella tularensis subsp. holarctica]|nr:type IV pili glycosylation protein [Francisella tularensis subsp. holarctica]
MVDKIQSFLYSKNINKIINAPIKISLPIMIAVFGLFIFVFVGLLVSPVLSKANQVQNHSQSMEAQIP